MGERFCPCPIPSLVLLIKRGCNSNRDLLRSGLPPQSKVVKRSKERSEGVGEENLSSLTVNKEYLSKKNCRKQGREEKENNKEAT